MTEERTYYVTTETLLKHILQDSREAKSGKAKEYAVSDLWVVDLVMNNAIDITYKVRREHYKKIEEEMKEILSTK